jgi:hypothetical protein
MLSTARLVASSATAVVTVAVLTGCFADHGADFGYPAAPSLPDNATLIVTDNGWDDDDPIRSNVQVIDFPGPAPEQLLDFYRAEHPPSDGWKTMRVGPVQELCLVRRTNNGYTQVLDVTPYAGARVAVQPDRHLVVMSRIEFPPRRPCRYAEAWIPSDLL